MGAAPPNPYVPVVRRQLNESSERRKEWLVALINSTPLIPVVPWEEAKLVMALAWQLSGKEGSPLSTHTSNTLVSAVSPFSFANPRRWRWAPSEDLYI